MLYKLVFIYVLKSIPRLKAKYKYAKIYIITYKHIYFLVEMFYYVLQGVNKYNIPEFRKEEN